jgi:hypothetical protein
MNQNLLWISTLLAATASIGTAHSADKLAADKQAAEKLGEHPAVIVARNWSARGIDSNTFIVAHPARLQLVARSPSEKQPTVVAAEATAAAGQ